GGWSGGDLRTVPPARELAAPARLLVEEVIVRRLLREDLVRVQDAQGVVEILQAAPPGDLLGAVLESGEVALESSQPVPCRDRSPQLDRVPEDLSGDRPDQLPLLLVENQCRVEVPLTGVGHGRH